VWTPGLAGHPRLTLKLAVEVALQIGARMQHAWKVLVWCTATSNPQHSGGHRARADGDGFRSGVAPQGQKPGTPATWRPTSGRGESLRSDEQVFTLTVCIITICYRPPDFCARAGESEVRALTGRAPRMLQPDLPDEMDHGKRCLAKFPGAAPKLG